MMKPFPDRAVQTDRFARFLFENSVEIHVGMSARDLDDLIDANKGSTLLGLKDGLDRNLGLEFHFDLERVTGIEILRPDSQ